METFEDDDKTTTKAPTTTTPTTTVAPDFQCYMCAANSNGNVTGEYQIICDAIFYPYQSKDFEARVSYNTSSFYYRTFYDFKFHISGLFPHCFIEI